MTCTMLVSVMIAINLLDMRCKVFGELVPDVEPAALRHGTDVGPHAGLDEQH